MINSNPLKLREYLATGKPIVSVPAPEIDRFADSIRIGRTPSEFLAHIDDALVSDTAVDRSRRLAAVAGMSWETRMADVIAVVEERLGSTHQQHDSIKKH